MPVHRGEVYLVNLKMGQVGSTPYRDTVNSGTIAGRKRLRRWRSINPFAQRLRIEPGELVEEGLNVRLDHERIEVLLLQEPFSLDMGQEFQQGSVETANVEQANGLAMQVELQPCERLEQFFHRSYPARQRDKGIREIGHLLLAFVHGIDGDERGQSLMRQVARDHVPRDHADDLAARGQSRVRHDAHQTNLPAAIDDRQVASGQYRAATAGGGGVLRQRTGA